MYDKQKNILMDCLDKLTDIQFVKASEHPVLTQIIIDTLGSYPKPRNKGDNAPEQPTELAAYLYTSIARNILKLSQLKQYDYVSAFSSAQNYFEFALGLLTDSNK